MASAGNGFYPSLEDMMKNGSPPDTRPAQKVRNVSPKTGLSLTAAVKAANKSHGKSKIKGSSSEPRKNKRKDDLNRMTEESEFSSDASNPNVHRRTPKTIPRTKVTATTPIEQRIALNILKQRLDFDDNKENIEENGDNIPKNLATMDAVSTSSLTPEIQYGDVAELNVGKINERLSQVCDYLKQATSIYVSLSVAGSHGNKDPGRTEQMDKLAKLIQQLRIQEKGYLDLLQKTNLDDKNYAAGELSDTSSAVVPTSNEINNAEASAEFSMQKQELERLKEQQALLRKIVDQQKELQQLKERQSALLKIQENAEVLIKENKEKEALNNLQKNQRTQQSDEARSSNNRHNADMESGNCISNNEDVNLSSDDSTRRHHLEGKIKSLQVRKDEMDQLMSALKNVQNVEANIDDVAADMAAVGDSSVNEMNVNEKIMKLNDVRERLSELKSLVADYELSNPNKVSTEASRDNRIHAQAMQQKDGNTVTGAGGARLRLPNVNNQDVVLNDLQALQKGIEELMDNRKRPAPKGREKKKIDVTRNPPSKKLKSKNTNQERGLTADPHDFEAFLKDLPEEYMEKMKELQLARQRVAGNYSPSDKESYSVATVTTQTGESEEDSEDESTSSSVLQWNEDPEFQTKVKKLQMAKEKLHHLQELVKVVQQGGGPQLPVDDLEDLTLTFSDDQEDDSSAYGESEEEATEEGETGEEDELEEEEIGEHTDNEEQSEASKSTDINMNFAPENGLSDNERRYQGLLRKQRIELNYLLKDRERLLEAQQKLSALATQPNSIAVQTQTTNKGSSLKKKTKSATKPKVFPKLTEAELNKQDRYKNSPKRHLFAKIEDIGVDPYMGCDQEYSQQIVDESVDKVPLRAPLSNPMAVTEIRRQRELFEQKKKQTFVEKQRKKKLRGEKNQSDDGGTYSVHSDIDEGVGVSMYSADVTTAATWGGSTEQSSSEDSAVEEDYADNEHMNCVDEEYGSQFDQVEEEEEVAGDNAPPIFKVKKYEEPRRGISWYQDDVRPTKKSLGQGNSSVSWMPDGTPPRGKKKLRQGNLTYDITHDPPSGQLHTQLATMCTSLLRNEQTLLSMLQTQTTRGSQDLSTQAIPNIMCNAFKNIQGFFETHYNESFQQTLHSLRACYERVEQHQLDMEYLRQQFASMNPSTQTAGASNSEYRSPWPDPAPLHISSFLAGNNTERKTAEGGSVSHSHAEILPVVQKETQTDTTLFEDPFKIAIQPYTLFGGDTSLEANNSPSKKNEEDFDFTPVVEAVSPGAIGDRSFAPPYEQDMAAGENKFPYRLRMSEYNPLSYQGNFPQASTVNTVAISRLSMKKEQAETTVTDGPEKSIWPSFFKVPGGASQPDNTSERSSKYTSSFAGHSASNELNIKVTKTEEKTDESVKDPNQTDFDRLRDSIYSEVATLIAMNEARPHYLIELFRELQLLNSDYLRQRSLFSLNELVTRVLTDEATCNSPSKTAFKQETIPATSTQTYDNWVASTSEQTPSESALTTDDESESLALQTLARQIQNNEIYDYAELADSQSEGNLSTPGSHTDAPFAAENLGNTVINLDEALQKMKIYEQNMAKAKKTFEEISQNVRESTPASQLHYNQVEAIKNQISNTIDTISNSSAGDVTSEASSDMPQPSFDTQKLDRQIKSVMRDLIPFLNEHIESICNEELLDEIRNLIVHFAQQKEPCSEKEQFGKFFHTQLDSILRGSLMKFNARKLKECGEDILIDVSEILFNELSFFKLMQDLNRPLYNGTCSEMYGTQDGDSGSQSKMPFLNQDKESEEVNYARSANVGIHAKSASHSSTSSSNTFVVVDPAVDITDDETESQRQFVNVELSVCETRPIRSSGSGEDDHEEEPSTFSKVSIPASSILQYSQVVMQSSSSGEHAAGGSGFNDQNQLQQLLDSAVQDGDEDREEMVEDDRDEGDRDEGAREDRDHDDSDHDERDREESDVEARQDERSEHEREAGNDAAPEDEGVVENESAEDQRDLDAVVEAEGSVQDALNGEPEAEGQGDGNHQENDAEEGEEDDLPEADMVSEDNNIAIAGVVLAYMEGQQELAGDPVAMPPLPGNPVTC